MKRHLVVGAVLVAGAGVCAGAQAANVTYEISGIVGSGAANYDNSSGLLGTFASSQTYHFFFSLNDAPVTDFLGTATYGPASGGMNASVNNGTTFLSIPNGILSGAAVSNTGAGDAITVNAGSPLLTSDAFLSLSEGPPGPLSNDSLSGILQALNFDNRSFKFTIRNGLNVDFFNGSVTSVQAVPLPAAAWLMLSGVGALGAFARRRRQTAGALAA